MEGNSYGKKMDGKKIFELGNFWHDGDVRRRRVLIAIAGCILLGIGVVMFWPGEREPEYQGKRLSEWINIAGSNLSGADFAIIGEDHNFDGIKSAEALRAVRAIRTMGTNALPFLVKWISYDRSKWDKMLDMYDKLPRVLVSDSVEDWIIGGRERKKNLAVLGFDILREDAARAVPGLVKIVGDSKAKRCRYDALLCLRMIGGAARPAIPQLKEIAAKLGDNSSPFPGEVLFTAEVIEAGGMMQFMTNKMGEVKQ